MRAMTKLTHRKRFLAIGIDDVDVVFSEEPSLDVHQSLTKQGVTKNLYNLPE